VKRLSGSQIRSLFLQFFQQKGHRVEPSASLIPVDDPSLLWINSGVATLKKYFDGTIVPENPRITNVQKSIRTNDIENVGKTARHHTFFEMLGNFSIGDYFKEEAITWAWEFLTSPEWIGFEPERLWVTIHPEDDEAFRIWHEKIGLPEERIIRLEGNFWDIGEGPCGPNSEIFYDRGEAFGNDPNDPELYPGGENERFLEVWNLVFSQYNHNPDGSYTPLPKKNIDTGMGLERMASILQDVETNFETDLIKPIIDATVEMTGKPYKQNRQHDVAYNVIADHLRTIVFAIGDGALPGNEGRGYVIRRLLRRAVRYGRELGLTEPFLYKLVPVVGEIMGDFYPEVVEKREFIQRVIRHEEERFLERLSEGLEILEQMLREAEAEGRKELSGKQAFLLYDTFGFPLDLTVDFAAERGFAVDQAGFDEEMEAQRARARAARQEVDSMKVQGGVLEQLPEGGEFVGYTQPQVEARVVAIVDGEQLVDVAGPGKQVQLLLDRTPFYAESGGQVADCGTLTAPGLRMIVEDVQKGPRGQHLHRVRIEEGTVRVGATVTAEIDEARRRDTEKNHTATHLLHRALKDVLGEHANQAGSLVAPDRLRFDFTHFGAMSEEELQQVERRVNEQIWRNLEVTTMHKRLQEAREMGAMALFGEKYGEVVRVVQVGDYSLELCGGCHVRNTAEIGLFKIVSESGIGSGTRRIEAVTGKQAYVYLEEQLQRMKRAAELLKASPAELVERVEALQGQFKELQRENESLRGKLGHLQAQELVNRKVDVQGVNVVAAAVPATDMEGLRAIADDVKEAIKSGVVLLGSVTNGKVQLVAMVTPDLVKRGLHAGNIVKEAARRCGGGGGGRPDMAQAGGKDPAKLQEALKAAEEMVAQAAAQS